jgi:ABC-type transport system involved in multi-copper enzyme maturation permease subunit
MTDTPDATVEEIAVEPHPSASVGAVTRRRRPSPFGAFGRTAGGVGAVGAKELRGRMRGRRAFVILSVYLVLLAGFAWMVELIMERTYQSGSGANAALATAAIGQGIFAALLMLETLLVAFLAPMATAGSISLEREKQTLEMLAATPITSAAIVLGKLLSALVYVWLLIAASIPLTAVVFVFGGVAPEDLVRGYLVLVMTALGFGSFGLLCSSLVKRTQAATAITIFGVLGISMGSLFVIFFWQAFAGGATGTGMGPIRGSAPAPLLFLNPFLAQADVAPTDALCQQDNALRYYCRFRSTFLLDQNGVFFVDNSGVSNDRVIIGKVQTLPANGGFADGSGVGVAPDFVQPPNANVVPFGAPNDAIWSKTVVAWLVLSAVFLVLSVQFVSPTRRWRLRRGRRAGGGIT